MVLASLATAEMSSALVMACPLVVFPSLIPSGSGLFNGELGGERERITGVIRGRCVFLPEFGGSGV